MKTTNETNYFVKIRGGKKTSLEVIVEYSASEKQMIIKGKIVTNEYLARFIKNLLKEHLGKI